MRRLGGCKVGIEALSARCGADGADGEAVEALRTMF